MAEDGPGPDRRATQGFGDQLSTIRRRRLAGAIAVVVGVAVLLVGLEVAQRVRYSLRNQNWCWMTWGMPAAARCALGTSARVGPTGVPTAIVASGDNAAHVLAQARRGDGHARVRVACLGGSSTVGAFNRPGHDYPRYLKDRLEAMYAQGVDVLNLGVSGLSSDGYWTYVEAAAAVPADVVVFYTGYNDTFIRMFDRSVAAMVGRSLAWSLLRPVLRYSLAASTVYEKAAIAATTRPPTDADRETVRALEQDLAANVASAVQHLKERGVASIVIPEVVMLRDFGSPTTNYAGYAWRYRNVPALLRETAAATGAEYLDLGDVFPPDQFWTYFIDPVHLTDAGNERLAAAIATRSGTLRALLARRGPRAGGASDR